MGLEWGHDPDEAESFLDSLERRERRARVRKPARASRKRAACPQEPPVRPVRLPVHGPPAPSGFRAAGAQQKAAEARRGNRNAARSVNPDDVLGVLHKLDEIGALRWRAAQALADAFSKPTS